MSRPGVVWAAALGALAVYDVVCDRRHDESTLSAVTRRTFRTQTPAGRAAFVAAWTALSVWLLPHICRAAEASSPDLHPIDRAVRLLDGLNA